MESLLLENKLTNAQAVKLKKYAREKQMLAFQKTLEKYRDTIGDWELTDYKDAGANWKSESTLKCMCGKTLRYQYTVTNQKTAEILTFGITHLKGHTKFSDEVIRDINKQIRIANKAVHEMEERLLNDWKLNMEVPADVILPENITKLLEEGMPLSRIEENELIRLIQEAERVKWKRGRIDNSNGQTNRDARTDLALLKDEDCEAKGKIKRIEPGNGPFELWPHEQEFVEDMLYSSVGSAMLIAVELHSTYQYSDRFRSGRPKVYPLVVYYLDRLVQEGKAELSQDLGFTDRIYKVLEVQ